MVFNAIKPGFLAALTFCLITTNTTLFSKIQLRLFNTYRLTAVDRTSFSPSYWLENWLLAGALPYEFCQLQPCTQYCT